jgi:hypothetical protein
MPITHGTEAGYNWYGCHCTECTEAKIAANQRRLQRNTDTTRSRLAWTSEELDFATERDASGNYVRTAYECAIKLQRTIHAVDQMRIRSKHDPEPIEPVGPDWGGMDHEIGGGLGGDFQRLPKGF